MKPAIEASRTDRFQSARDRDQNGARTLLLLGCGFEQIEALQIARELGYRTVAFDNDAAAPGRHVADEFFQVDLRNPEALLGQAELCRPDGVFVHAAELAVEAALVSESLGLPGLGVETARNATDKSLRIEKLADASIRTPRFRILESAVPHAAQWIDETRAIDFPKVLKPINQAGARGVVRIDDEAQLEAYFAGRDAYRSERFVCEELLSGVQLSTESIALEGKLLHHAIALRHYDTTSKLLPCFIEDGHSLPYALSPALRASVESTIERCFGALDVASGVLKGDLLISDGGEVVVLEMAARTSGGRFADTVVPLGTGVHILYPLIEMAMGDSFSRDWLTPTRHVGVSQRFFLHDSASRVLRWPALRQLIHRPGVAAVQMNEALLRSGTLPPIRSHRDRLGYVICTGETREQADAAALEITQAFRAQLELEPIDPDAAEAGL
jgi:biotin carboxylase